MNLAHQAGLVFSIIDSRMGSYPSECVERLLDLALRCCNEKQDKRPHMLEVVRELENILKITPSTDTIFSPSTTSYGDQSPTSSSLLTGDRSYVSSSLAGSDLTSGAVPTIVPRWRKMPLARWSSDAAHIGGTQRSRASRVSYMFDRTVLLSFWIKLLLRRWRRPQKHEFGCFF